nr:MAG TPA: holin [Caudoviricetes sp.]
MKKNIVRKLTSRKLWMSFASFVMNLLVFFGYTENTAAQVAALIMAGATVIGYVIGEGLADSSTRGDVIEDKEPEA